MGGECLRLLRLPQEWCGCSEMPRVCKVSTIDECCCRRSPQMHTCSAVIERDGSAHGCVANLQKDCGQTVETSGSMVLLTAGRCSQVMSLRLRLMPVQREVCCPELVRS